jgi:hypothetical protein
VDWDELRDTKPGDLVLVSDDGLTRSAIAKWVVDSHRVLVVDVQ